MRSWGTDGNLYALHKHEQELDRQQARDDKIEELRSELSEDELNEILGDVFDCITVSNVEKMSYEELGREISTEYERLAREAAERKLDEMELYGEY